MTNREWFEERIRNMSNKELAEAYLCFCDFCTHKDTPKCYTQENCKQGHLDWLAAEHKESNND